MGSDLSARSQRDAQFPTSIAMNFVVVKILGKLRKIHARFSPKRVASVPPEPQCRGQEANDRIKELLMRDQPCMICRLGGSEAEILIRYLDVTDKRPFLEKAINYVKGRGDRFWWDKGIRWRIYNSSGFFPATEEMVERFSREMLNDLQNIDILGSWLKEEVRLSAYLNHVLRIPLGDLSPFWTAEPWSESLAGKKVLVIHPFEESIKRQYAKRELLFKNEKVLPPFELKTLKSVQSIVGNFVPFKDWFEALESMKTQVNAIDFDIALIGAGAYGLALASHVKTIGKKAIHLGGATQLLFGIRGKRWDDRPDFQELYNEHWVRPLAEEIPTNYKSMESGAYW